MRARNVGAAGCIRFANGLDRGTRQKIELRPEVTENEKTRDLAIDSDRQDWPTHSRVPDPPSTSITICHLWIVMSVLRLPDVRLGLLLFRHPSLF